MPYLKDKTLCKVHHCREPRVEQGSAVGYGRCKFHRSLRVLRARLSKSGMTLAQATTLMTQQGWQCPVCGDCLTWQTAHIDHDHACCDNSKGQSCGQCVRDFLCTRCNMALGNLRDEARIALGAALYLEEWQRDLVRKSR